MTSVCDTASDTVLASSLSGDVTKAFTIERGTSSDALSLVIAAAFSDAIDATDAAAQVVASMASDLISATSAASQALTAQNLVEDVASIRAALLSSYSVTISDPIDATDALVQRLSHSVVETVSVDDVALTALQASTVVIDQALVTDACPPFMTNYVIDTIDITDSVSYLNTASIEVSDAVDVTDAVSVLATYLQHVTDTIGTSDSVSTSLSAVNVVVDESFAQDFVTGPAGAAWSALAQTWGMSRYANMPFNSIASIGGQFVLASDDGFYTLNADNDGSSEVAASISLGKSEGKGGYLRRPREIYIGYNGGRLAATVAGTVNGVETEYSYPFPVQVATDDTAAKVEPGRGLRSRYFTYGFQNQNGSRFQLRDARIMFDDTSRRV